MVLTVILNHFFPFGVTVVGWVFNRRQLEAVQIWSSTCTDVAQADCREHCLSVSGSRADSCLPMELCLCEIPSCHTHRADRSCWPEKHSLAKAERKAHQLVSAPWLPATHCSGRGRVLWTVTVAVCRARGEVLEFLQDPKLRPPCSRGTEPAVLGGKYWVDSALPWAEGPQWTTQGAEWVEATYAQTWSHEYSTCLLQETSS